jgi:hypothetical protein
MNPRDCRLACGKRARLLVTLTELELDDGGQSEAVSPGLSPTVGFKESFNIARHDRRKQDVLHLCPLSLKITRFIQGPSFSYKDYNTPARLGELTNPKLLSLGVSDKEDRRLVLSALNAAGYRAIAVTNAKQRRVTKNRTSIGAKDDDDDQDVNDTSAEPSSTVIIRLAFSRNNDTTELTDFDSSRDCMIYTVINYTQIHLRNTVFFFKPKKPSSSSSSPPPPPPPSSSPVPAPASSSPRKKRKYGDGDTRGPSSSSSRFEKNEYLPSPAAEEDSEGAALLDGGLDFHEISDEEALRHKFTVVNRAPVMMAWACVVAERLGFLRDEALSIGKLQHSLLRSSAKKTPLLYFLVPVPVCCSLCVYRNERCLQRRFTRHL